MENTHISLPIFAGENYEFWCKKMKTLLASLDLWEIVDEGYDNEEGDLTVAQLKELKKLRRNDAMALSKIQQAVADSIFPRIMRAEKSKEAWEILQKEFGGDEKVRAIKLQTLRRDFENLKKNDDEKKVDATIYRSLIGSLLYLCATRPDVMFASSMLSRFMSSPSQVHLGAAKRVLRYIKGTTNYGIKYWRGAQVKLQGYYDSDWAGCVDDMKSNSGFAFSLGSSVFSWTSKKQESVAQSSAEAEYVAAAVATSQVIWLKKILGDIGMKQEEATELFCDNKSAIAMSKNPVFHSRTRHINIKYHFIREAIEEGEVQPTFCRSEDQVADIFTKALPKEKFFKFRELLGIMEQHIKGEKCS